MIVFHLPPRTVSANSVGQLNLFASGFVIGCYRSAYPADEVPRFAAHDQSFTAGCEGTQMKVLAMLTLMPEADFATVRATTPRPPSGFLSRCRWLPRECFALRLWNCGRS